MKGAPHDVPHVPGRDGVCTDQQHGPGDLVRAARLVGREGALASWACEAGRAGRGAPSSG